MAAFLFPDGYNHKTREYDGKKEYDPETCKLLLEAIAYGPNIVGTKMHTFTLSPRSILQIGKASGHSRQVVIGTFRPIAWVLALYPEVVRKVPREQSQYVFGKLFENTIAMGLCFPGMFPYLIADSCDLIIGNMKNINGFESALLSRDVIGLDRIARISEKQATKEVDRFLASRS